MVRIASILAILILTARGESRWPQFRGPAGASTAVGEMPPAALDGTRHLLSRASIPDIFQGIGSP